MEPFAKYEDSTWGKLGVKSYENRLQAVAVYFAFFHQGYLKLSLIKVLVNIPRLELFETRYAATILSLQLCIIHGRRSYMRKFSQRLIVFCTQFLNKTCVYKFAPGLTRFENYMEIYLRIIKNATSILHHESHWTFSVFAMKRLSIIVSSKVPNH
ncbi:hypothetical protein BDP67DRAFT_490118 [Colletotrichum lupini]|nr:hypothetical protein BDP67DRAFT_490118 [Colletotrichum lupini]